MSLPLLVPFRENAPCTYYDFFFIAYYVAPYIVTENSRNWDLNLRSQGVPGFLLTTGPKTHFPNPNQLSLHIECST